MTKDSKKSSESSKKVQEFKDTFKTEGEHLVKNVFPQKIIELEEIHKSMGLSKIGEIHSDLNIPVPDPVVLAGNGLEEPSKKRKFEHGVQGTEVLSLPCGVVPANKKLVDICEQLKPFIRDLIDHSNTIKMWISFLIPKIEDGNNFGVSIQEETLGEARQVESDAATYLDQISRYFISRGKLVSNGLIHVTILQEETLGEARQVESDAATYLDQISRYFISRGKLVSKVAKYPHIDDYRQSIRELDEKEYFSLRLTSAELRNHYASLHDMIMKNFDKILKPRNANAENLY